MALEPAPAGGAMAEAIQTGRCPMHILMLGWEFPPYITGGLGTACYGLARAMGNEGVAVTFVMPAPPAEAVAAGQGKAPRPTDWATTAARQRAARERIDKPAPAADAVSPPSGGSAAGPLPTDEVASEQRPSKQAEDEAPRSGTRRTADVESPSMLPSIRPSDATDATTAGTGVGSAASHDADADTAAPDPMRADRVDEVHRTIREDLPNVALLALPVHVPPPYGRAATPAPGDTDAPAAGRESAADPERAVSFLGGRFVPETAPPTSHTPGQGPALNGEAAQTPPRDEREPSTFPHPADEPEGAATIESPGTAPHPLPPLEPDPTAWPPSPRGQGINDHLLPSVGPAGGMRAMPPRARLIVRPGPDSGSSRSSAASQPPPSPTPPPFLASLRFVPDAGLHYSGDLLEAARRYSSQCVRTVRDEPFDAIHAHDWLTFPAGLALAAITCRPLIVHIHSTEHERTGGRPDRAIFDIERRGMLGAARVIAVSKVTRQTLIRRYRIPAWKIGVVYNGIAPEPPEVPPEKPPEKPPGKPPEDRCEAFITSSGEATAPAALSTGGEHASLLPGKRIVAFVGRLTAQKGPAMFLKAASKLAECFPDVKFVIAGTGDLAPQLIETAAQSGLGDRIVFTGFLDQPELTRLLAAAEVLVMPSLNEPFGLATLEAISHRVPVIVSRHAGVSEVIRHALKVDPDDIDAIADRIAAVLRHPPLSQTLREKAEHELKQLTWERAARGCLHVYHQALRTPMPAAGA